MIHITDHFSERVRQRIGPIDPCTLARELREAVETGRTDFVRYLGRQDREGKRRAAFVARNRRFVVVWRNIGEDWTFITVHPEGREDE